jgi:hypothetical protein
MLTRMQRLSTHACTHAVLVNAGLHTCTVAVIACSRTCSGSQHAPVRAHAVVATACVRACTCSGSHCMGVRASGATSSSVQVWYRARLCACSGGQRRLTRMQQHSTHAHPHMVAVNASLRTFGCSPRRLAHMWWWSSHACAHQCARMQWWQPRACERARTVAVIACKYAQVVFIAGNFIHRARVQYRARLRTCSGSHRMLAHM